jgi:oligopeptide/dipeptide ABC transporter ATP-binding protein
METGVATCEFGPSILEVERLRVAYHSHNGASFDALAGVSFALRRGEILGVLGESGSGKSTLAAALLRLLPPNGRVAAGRVVLEGQELLEANPKTLQEIRGARISLLAQEPSLALHPTMRIVEQVEEVLRAHERLKRRARRQRAVQVLSKLFTSDVERIAQSYPHQLSGGQRQRAVIAQATVCQPDVVIADEPTASLDPTTRREILGLFRTLRDELGLSVIWITHNPAMLIGFAQRVLVLYAGRIVELAPTEDVLFSPRHPYTQALLRCLPTFESRTLHKNLQSIPGTAANLAALPTGCVFEPRCSERMEECRLREPDLLAVTGSHRVACFKCTG